MITRARLITALQVIITAARRYETQLPPEKRVKTAAARRRSAQSELSHGLRNSSIDLTSMDLTDESVNLDVIYAEVLRDSQIQTHK